MKVNKITAVFNRCGFKIKKYSPEILMAMGIAGVVTSTVLACKGTMGLGELLEDSKNKIDEIKANAKNSLVNNESEILEEEIEDQNEAKELTIVYVQTAWGLIKLYGPALIVGTASIISILASNGIIKKRNAALATAYTLVDNGFKAYRNRVVERFGDDVDKELKYGIRKEIIEETVIDENGKKKIEHKEINVIDDLNMHKNFSPYAKFFDEGSQAWEKDADANLCFLRLQQAHANNLLQANHYLFLNDVYDLLGIPRTKAGQIMGWIWDPNDKTKNNYVDFGIYDVHYRPSRDFVNGYERNILLDFNIDGNILDSIDGKYSFDFLNGI